MTSRTKPLATALAALLAGAAAAAPVHHAPRRADATIELLKEVAALRREVAALRARVDAQAAAPVPIAAAPARDARAPALAAPPPAQTAASGAPPATLDQSQSRLTATAQPVRRAPGLVWNGITITPAGFVELAGVYRDHFQGNDIASSLLVPFPSNPASHAHELRFSARQSRFSLLAQGRANAATQLAMFVEFDFLGAAQTANSNQSNSYNPRLRHLYGTIDWDRGEYALHLLAGQSWSLVTPNIRGIVPRTEFVPPQIESQNLPGYYFARQPGIRLAADLLDHRLWLAASVENPQTTFAGAAPPGIVYNAPAGLGFDAANSLSINQVPDVIGKVAYDADVAGHAVHVEGFGIARTFTDHVVGGGNRSMTTLGYGGGMVAQVVPGRFDIEVTGFGGRGIGRYGSAGLPDITFSGDGRLHAVPEIMLMAGGTLHASHALDVYALAGLEREMRTAFAAVGGIAYGLGNPLANNAGCLVENGSCAGNTRRVRQLTLGFWDRFYQGDFGRAQVGLQYSLTQRRLFEGIGGAPQASNSMGFLSFRYYPF